MTAVDGPEETPAESYKREISGISGGVEAEAERNRARLRELRERVAELDRDLSTAADRRVLVRIAANLAWEAALEALWVESWMTMRPFPRPDRLAKGGDVLELGAEIELRAAELIAAVKGRGGRN